MSMKDAVQAFAVDLFGALLIAAGFAWAGFDASQHDGRAAMTTLAGALVLTSVGGFLISKHKMLELFDFLFTQAGRARGLHLPSDGSDDATK